MSERPNFDPDQAMRDIIDEVQMRVAQQTGQVPQLPFYVAPNGTVHDLVEEEIRD